MRQMQQLFYLFLFIEKYIYIATNATTFFFIYDKLFAQDASKPYSINLLSVLYCFNYESFMKKFCLKKIVLFFTEKKYQ